MARAVQVFTNLVFQLITMLCIGFRRSLSSWQPRLLHCLGTTVALGSSQSTEHVAYSLTFWWAWLLMPNSAQKAAGFDMAVELPLTLSISHSACLVRSFPCLTRQRCEPNKDLLSPTDKMLIDSRFTPAEPRTRNLGSVFQRLSGAIGRIQMLSRRSLRS